MYKVKPQPSDYGFNTLPPDFTWHHIRSGYELEDIYIRLVAGVGGAAMPSWKDVLSDEDIWAVSHYVDYLVDLKNNPERRKLMNEIKAKNEEFKNR
jgi:mono/diheme cytochrome c family protein